MEFRRSLALAVLTLMMAAPLVPPAAANHQYDQPVWFNWPIKTLDVLVISGDDPLIGKAIEDAIDAWVVGIPQFAPTLGLTLNVYWPGKDVLPPAGFSTDILVAPQGFFAVHPGTNPNAFGVPKCYAFAPMMVGWGALYSVTSHEFGHCLGLGHVFNHGVEYSPAKDIMGSGNPAKACPSNLNVEVLQRVYSGVGGTVTKSATSYAQSSC